MGALGGLEDGFLGRCAFGGGADGKDQAGNLEAGEMPAGF